MGTRLLYYYVLHTHLCSMGRYLPLQQSVVVDYIHSLITNSGVTCSVVEETGFGAAHIVPPPRWMRATPNLSIYRLQMTSHVSTYNFCHWPFKENSW